MANTTVWIASNGHHWVTRTTASTIVVRMAANRGPRGSTAGPVDMVPPAGAPGGCVRTARVSDRLGGTGRASAPVGPGATQAAADAAEVDCASLRQEGGQPGHG